MNDYKELIDFVRLGAELLDKKGFLILGAGDMIRLADTIEQLVKERDAAIATIPHRCWSCGKGYHTEKGFECEEAWYKGNNQDCLNWDWRGVVKAMEEQWG